MAPWLPDHEASQCELPEEVSALHAQAAAMHSKCMASDHFMAAIQQEAACMTARQAEKLQVCYVGLGILHVFKSTQILTRVLRVTKSPHTNQ